MSDFDNNDQLIDEEEEKDLGITEEEMDDDEFDGDDEEGDDDM